MAVSLSISNSSTYTMKKEVFSIIKSCAFIALIVFVLDFIVGRVFDNMIKKLPSEGERVAKSYYAFHKVDADIVIIGSSRAETTYDCEIIMDSLPGYMAFNCGGDGQAFFYCNTLINTILDRYTPRCIVWDVSVWETGGGNYEDLSLVYPFYKENNNVRKTIDEIEGSTIKYKLLFNSYRFNATAGRILRAFFFTSTSNGSVLGFWPRKSVDNSRMLVPKDFVISDDSFYNENKINCISETLERANSLGCKVVMVISPMYNDYNQDNKHSRKMAELCQLYNAFFVDDSHLDGFVHNHEYAYDRVHVKDKGAKVFSEIFAHQLSAILDQ